MKDEEIIYQRKKWVAFVALHLKMILPTITNVSTVLADICHAFQAVQSLHNKEGKLRMFFEL